MQTVQPDKTTFKNIIRDILQGLDYLEKRNIIHRDLKPANILVHKTIDGEWKAKIADFGLSKSLDNSATSTHGFKGTIEYMAPEQIYRKKYAENQKIQTNADLWAFGIILYELFSTKIPVGRRSEGSTIEEIMENLDIFEPNSLVLQDIPSPYKQMIQICLVKFPQKRVQTAQQLLQLLSGKTTNNEETLTLISPTKRETVYIQKPRKNPTSRLPSPIQELEKNMITVQGGSFTMGCTNTDDYCRDDEKPAHNVTLRNFAIGCYPVTQAQWQAIMNRNASPKPYNGDYPIVTITWTSIQTFLKKLNRITKKNYRLLTEAEWEFAARGGNSSNGYKYSGSNELNTVGWHSSNSNFKLQPVGQKTSNEIGIYDMSGNIWEWCSDWYKSNYYAKSPSTNPSGAFSGKYRVLRGGSWNTKTMYCRITTRNCNQPNSAFDDVGFRIARTL